MKYAFLVAWREYAESAKTKGFWISLFMFPAILFLSVQVPIFLHEKGTPTRYFVLVDQSGDFEAVLSETLDASYQKQLFGALKDYARKNSAKPGGDQATGDDTPQSVKAFLKNGGQEPFLKSLQPWLKPNAPAFKAPRRDLVRAPLPPGLDSKTDLATLARDLKPYLRGDKQLVVNGQSSGLYAAILIPRDIQNQIVRPNSPKAPASGAPTGEAGSVSGNTPVPAGIQYWSTDVTPAKEGSGLPHEIEQAVNNEIHRGEYLSRGVDVAALRQVEQIYAPLVSLNPKKETGQEAVNTADIVKQWAPSAFVYLLWVAVFAINQMLLSNTIEEKSNRIIEVLLSSVTPGELMMGKLAGIAAIGLTMIGGWMVAVFAVLSWKSGGASDIAGHVLTVLKTSNLVPLFSVYFLLGYLLYGGLILSLGSVCNTLKEAQSYMGVLTMLLMVPLLTMTYIPRDPNGTVARVFSWIPIYTPFTMMNRAGADPPLIDLIGTLVLLLATTGAVLWMSGKIFRIGILRTGQPPKIIEMLRWIRG
ncbi:MAG TPA: ABC transporter permease [Candidatus Binatia bacterium]|jgi:ABC-2 type transport system permease protein|nr:ABC transporter permease [Candidatus Binatia bacterium]